MKNAVIFTAGIIAGAIGTPVAIMYVKPIRRAFASGASRFCTYVIIEESKKGNSELVEVVNNAYSAFTELVAVYKKEDNNA